MTAVTYLRSTSEPGVADRVISSSNARSIPAHSGQAPPPPERDPGGGAPGFRDRGYHATTLDDIVAQLGIRKTALYHYFPDKESILYACQAPSQNPNKRQAGGMPSL
jgi:hypothetical protein